MKSLTSNSTKNPGSVWIIGLSSAGKSTLARGLVARLRDNDYPCMLIDGDEVRAIFADRLGYDPESRRKQTQRILALTQWVSGHGILPIVAIIHPFENDRRRCRETLDKYVEIYLHCDLSECIKRDKKNVYVQALEGNAENVVGVDIPYDEPAHADLVLDSMHTTQEAMLETLWKYVEREILPCYPLRVMNDQACDNRNI